MCLKYAHSGEGGNPPQLYQDHINNVVTRALKNAKECFKYSNKNVLDIIKIAALYHDLGKLDDKNQEILSGTKIANKLPINHVDAGTAFLLDKNFYSAYLVNAHHRGLINLCLNNIKKGFRDTEIEEYTNKNLDVYIKAHNKFVRTKVNNLNTDIKLTPLEIRLLLSCLVDADYYDTANFYNKVEEVKVNTNWGKRLKQLDKYISRLKKGRADIREKLYKACRTKTIDGIEFCSSPVGTGKTTAIMASLLKTAKEKNLRHIFVVIPYTNIISQNVEVYREALCLANENKEYVVAEHHHAADFDSIKVRHLATTWEAKIIVTTAVQFFETLASNHPARLRKLHELPGSAIFIDEAHNAIPIELWGITWKWLEELVQNFSCRIVLASGSLVKFWENKNIVETKLEVKNMLPEDLEAELHTKEKERIQYKQIENVLTKEELKNEIEKHPGSKLIIFNTIQSAAVFADYLSNFYKAKNNLFHLSTALTPEDREKTINNIKDKLSKKEDIIVVATSCIEAGVDLSFNVAFRESCSFASLIQTGGRVNRHGENFGVVYDFRIKGEYFTENKQFTKARNILVKNFNRLNTVNINTILLKALEEEAKESNKSLINNDFSLQFEDTAKDYRVIDTENIFVVIDKNLITRIQQGEKIRYTELLKKSVQINKHKEQKIHCIAQIDEGIYGWYGEYDDFLGYMKQILKYLTNKEAYNII